MEKAIVCAMLLVSPLATFAEENEYDHVDVNDRKSGDSDILEDLLGISRKERKDRSARKKFYLDHGYRGFVSTGLLSGNYPGLRYSTSHGMQLDEKYFIGAGLGFYTAEGYFDELDYIPLYANFRVDFKDKNLSPFIDTKVGYTIVIEENRGFYANASCGYRFMKVSLSVGVETLPGLNCSQDEVSYQGKNTNEEFDIPSRIWGFNTRFAFEFDKHKK